MVVVVGVEATSVALVVEDVVVTESPPSAEVVVGSVFVVGAASVAFGVIIAEGVVVME